MAKETIQKVLDAENESNIAEQDAKEKAKQIVNNAKIKASELVKEKVLDANKKAEKKIADAIKEADAIRLSAGESVKSQIEAIEKLSDSKRDDMIKAVIESLI